MLKNKINLQVLRETSIALDSVYTILGLYGCFVLGSGKVALGLSLLGAYIVLGNLGSRIFWKLIELINRR